MMQSDIPVIASRFAPFHNGDLMAIRQMLQMAGRVVVLILGAETARSVMTPWTADEREGFVRAGLGDDAHHVVFAHISDHVYRPDLLTAEIAACVGEAATDYSEKPEMSAREADLREAFFMGDDAALRAGVPPTVLALLEAFRTSETFAPLLEEYRYVDDYKTSWQAAPYPPIFVTVDTVIVHTGHVLLIKRGGIPGKGLWALPGGFVEQDETLRDAALRELREETKIALDDVTLATKLVASKVFDAPHRSSRGRVISHGFHFVLGDGDLPVVEGADDAETAVWMPLSDIPALRDRFFEDHLSMLEAFDVLPRAGE